MSDRPPEGLRRFFHTPLSEERRERNWTAIAAALPARRRAPRARRSFALAFAMLATVILAVVGARFIGTPRGAIDGAVLQTGAGEKQSLELGDGSQVVLEPSTKLQLERVSGRGIQLRLEAGAMNAQVTHVDRRPFTVVAGPVEVHVVGTKFRVELDPADGDILVAVTEGRVSLTRTDGRPAPDTLGAGETWSSGAPSATPPEEATLDASSAVVTHHSPRATARPPTLSKRFRAAWRDGRFAAAWSEIPTADLDAIIASSGPQDLLAIAECARMSGHPYESARAFDSLRHRFRSDPRAPLAALELGRLRLNELGAPLDAKEAFEDAIALDPDGSFREDADARLIEALEAAGLSADCAAARDRYLSVHPDGLHARIVQRRCR